MRWNLFGRKEKPQDALQKASVPDVQPKQIPPPYLTQTVVFGMHLYRSPGEDSSVYFVDESRGIRKMIVDTYGNIKQFPGIVKEDIWTDSVSPSAMKPEIRFRTSFEKRDGKWLVLWEIQPDGRYWEDEDGFGETNDPEVVLYTFLDAYGCFTGPFRIYKIGIKRFDPK